MPGMIKSDSASPSPSESASHSLLSLHSSPSPPSAAAAVISTSSEQRGIRLIQLLYLCANAVAGRDIHHANLFLEQLSALASISGDPLQRVAAYFMEGLAARVTRTWPGLYRALHATRVSPDADATAARHVLFNVCPFLKFAFLTVNQTLLDVMQGERVVHLIDLGVTGVSTVLQWLALLQAFSSRPEGPPHLRVTAVNARREVLSEMGQRLSEAAERLDIPFQFHSVKVCPGELERDMLGVKTGEAVGVTSLMQLHRLLGDDDDPDLKLTNGENSREDGETCSAFQKVVKKKRGRDEKNGLGIGVLSLSHRAVKEEEDPRCSRIDRVLQLLHDLSPKVVVVVEQESAHNAPLHERFGPALHYYSAIFDSLDSTLPQSSVERMAVERLIFGQEIGNIVACEEEERVERHERMESWRRRFEKNRFTSVHLSPTTVVQAERLLTIHSPDGYKLQREKGSLTLCWQDTPLLSVSAWEA